MVNIDWSSCLGPVADETLGYPQYGAPAARVTGDLVGAWFDSARKRPEPRHVSAGADRLLRWTDTGRAFALDELLDDPVLQRMKRDHRQAPVRRQQIDRIAQRALEHTQLVIDGDP